jgi:hypothetical protein
VVEAIRRPAPYKLWIARFPLLARVTWPRRYTEWPAFNSHSSIAVATSATRAPPLLCSGPHKDKERRQRKKRAVPSPRPNQEEKCESAPRASQPAGDSALRTIRSVCSQTNSWEGGQGKRAGSSAAGSVASDRRGARKVRVPSAAPFPSPAVPSPSLLSFPRA